MKAKELAKLLMKTPELEVVMYEPVINGFHTVDEDGIQEIELIDGDDGLLYPPDLLDKEEVKESRKYLSI